MSHVEHGKSIVSGRARNGRNTNLILEAAARANFTKREFRILLLLLRQTHGYRRAEDSIRLEFWAEKTGLAKTHVCNTLAELEVLNVITRDGRQNYSLNMPDDWSPRVWPSKRPPPVTASGNDEGLPEEVRNVTDSGNERYRKGQQIATALKVTPTANLTGVLKGSQMTEGRRQEVEASGFKDWLESVTEAKNQPAAIYAMCQAVFPGWRWNRNGAKSPPEIARIGAILKQTDVGTLCYFLWRAAADRPSGDPLSYAQGILRRNYDGQQSKSGPRVRDHGEYPELHGDPWRGATVIVSKEVR